MKFLKKARIDQGQWFMPEILAIWEAEIRRITIPGQAEQKNS
jgi:hypothetical protein